MQQVAAISHSHEGIIIPFDPKNTPCPKNSPLCAV